MAVDPHGFARIATALGDGAVKNPRVAPLQRAFFAFSESN
jgi:hypothetical protein